MTIGSHVRVLDVDEDAEEEYTIVGSQEANPMEGRISDDSPFGFALQGPQGRRDRRRLTAPGRRAAV